MIVQPHELPLIAQFLQINSYSIKPFLYLASRPYRKELWKLFKNIIICSKWFPNTSHSEMQTVNQQTENGREIEIIIEKTM